jgi:TPP-dependent pyruvate/acetoin dehydrogenase alpha subunit
MATIGEGGMQTGASHEGINIAAVEKVPFVLVATNNRFAYSTPNDRQFGCVDLSIARLLMATTATRSTAPISPPAWR